MTPVKISFGAGGCPIPGWRNTDVGYSEPDNIDMSKPLPIDTASVDCVASEMAAEHLRPHDVWTFLEECHRILKRGGLIRITIPDFGLTLRLKDPEWMRVNQGVTGNDGSLRAQMRSILWCHGHQALWTADLMRDVLHAVGFHHATVQRAGESSHDALRDIEQHWRSVGWQVAWSESGCVEAVR